MSWISVKDKMPPPNRTVWGFDGKKVDVLYLENVKDGISEFKITHWRKLIKPRKPKKT